MLKFSTGKDNAKLRVHKSLSTFAILSGWSCPFAKDCLSKVKVNDEGKKRIEDGADTQFRCFSASQEAAFPTVYKQRKYNFDLLRKTDDQIGLIEESLPYEQIHRIHIGGDFYSENYFKAWAAVARNHLDQIFYAYTKSLRYWVNNLKEIPDNFILTASKGGKEDYLIDEYNLKCAEVVFTEEQAEKLGLEIDHDDSHAFLHKDNFALLLHGTQPKGSEAAEHWKRIKKEGKGYGKN